MTYFLTQVGSTSLLPVLPCLLKQLGWGLGVQIRKSGKGMDGKPQRAKALHINCAQNTEQKLCSQTIQCAFHLHYPKLKAPSHRCPKGCSDLNFDTIDCGS